MVGLSQLSGCNSKRRPIAICHSYNENQWCSEGDERGTAVKRGVKMGVLKGASCISRPLGATKLQSAPGADNPRKAVVYSIM